MNLRSSLFLLFLLAQTLPLRAHEIRPAYLQLTESRGGDLTILWRQPIAGDYAAPLLPTISTGWLQREPFSRSRSDSAYVREWHIASPHAAIAGATVEVGGLERTITDVLLRVTYADGTELIQLLTPSAPVFQIPAAGKSGLPVRQYLELGFLHIWSGIDHLLYVFGLMLLVRDIRTLIKTITGFTLAHSITLAAASLGYVNVPPAPVEAVIALSIVFVAAEVLNAREGRMNLAQRAPWVVAFGFGLLHGLGFAGALAEVGLPAHSIPAALLLFNVGIEIGQLTFIGSLMLAATALWRLLPRLIQQLQWMPPYLIGTVASFWLIQRVAAVF
ncbi:MAG: hypothetical protein JWO52_2196 [Gammaproteobacteria bacterium]|jgi:hypothetical protein|nr:hypothetical protein [Gammaproteobacteria bacterium]